MSIEVNTYNINDRKFGYRNEDDDLNTSQTRGSGVGGGGGGYYNDREPPRAYVNDYMSSRIDRGFEDDNDQQQTTPIQVNNPIYYQQPVQQPTRERTPPQPKERTTPSPPLNGVQQQQENEMANRQLYGGNGEDGDEDPNQAIPMRNAPNQEFYFNTRVRNTGYWGKVHLRRGTWMVIIGLFFMAVSLTIISVFWAFWYHPAANIPCRVIGITMLVWSTFTVIAGLITNWCMISDPIAKYFIGSPVRWTSWIMLGSSIAITIASVLITIYYTYWHNRWVNTPMIIIAIVFYFFGGLAFIFAFFYNFKLMIIDIKKAKMGPQAMETESEEEEEEDEEADDKLSELYAIKTANPYLATVHSVDSEGGKKDFRKKVVQLKPRNLLDTSYMNTSGNYSPDDSSFNNTINSKK